jgi:DeoR family myo-inositol catabolism operon transcriptional repressor
MIYNERVSVITNKLKNQSVVKVNELSEELNVSMDTVRRDLKKLENEGLLKCIRGGACSLDNDINLSAFINRNVLNVDKKLQAARKALKYIKNGDIVAMNSGTTNRIIAEEMVKSPYNITVITNNLSVMTVLLQQPSIKVIVPGGFLDSKEKSLYGHTCEKELSKYNSDICFLSINAVDLNKGFSDFRFDEINVIKIMAKNSKNAIAIMDSSKFEKLSKCAVFPIDNIDILISDNEISPKIVDLYNNNGINLI